MIDKQISQEIEKSFEKAIEAFSQSLTDLANQIHAKENQSRIRAWRTLHKRILHKILNQKNRNQNKLKKIFGHYNYNIRRGCRHK